MLVNVQKYAFATHNHVTLSCHLVISVLSLGPDSAQLGVPVSRPCVDLEMIVRFQNLPVAPRVSTLTCIHYSSTTMHFDFP